MKKNYNIDSPFLDRRTKLLPCQKEKATMLHFQKGWTIAEITKIFNQAPANSISRKSIEFILYPDRLKKCRQHTAAPATKRQKKKMLNKVADTRNYLKSLNLNTHE